MNAKMLVRHRRQIQFVISLVYTFTLVSWTVDDGK